MICLFLLVGGDRLKTVALIWLQRWPTWNGHCQPNNKENWTLRTIITCLSPFWVGHLHVCGSPTEDLSMGIVLFIVRVQLTSCTGSALLLDCCTWHKRMCINHTVVWVLKRLHKTNSLACHCLLAQALARPVSKVGWDANQLQDNVDGVFKVQANSFRPHGCFSSLLLLPCMMWSV